MPKPSDKKVTTLSVDFSGVEERRAGGGASAHVPEGDYLLELKDVAVRKNKSDDGHHVMWAWKIVEGAGTGTVYDNTSLKPEALWKLRNVLMDLRNGVDLPKKALNIDFSKYLGKRIGATLEDGEPYNGKIKSQIAYTFPASEWEGKGATDADSDDEEAEELQSVDAVDDADEDEEELETVDLEDI